MKIRYIVILSVLILGGIGFAVASSSDLQGRFTAVGGRSASTETESAKGSSTPLSSSRDYSTRFERLSETLDTLSEDFEDWMDADYSPTVRAGSTLNSYADYEELKDLALSAMESGQTLQAEFDSFFTEYKSINVSKLSTAGIALFNDLKDEIDSIAYTTSTGSYSFEDIYTTALPASITFLDGYADRIARLGDLEILSIDASVGTDGRLYFSFSVINNSDESGPENTLTMPVGDIDLEGDYWIEGSSKSYFGMTITHDGELEPDVPTTVTGSLDIASRTSAIYEAYLEGESIYFDVTGFIASSGEIKESDRSNNAYSEAGSVE